MTLTKVQAATNAYKNQTAIQRSRPANQSAFENASRNKDFYSRQEECKSFASILKNQMQKT